MSTPKAFDEKELLLKLQMGDFAAFNALYDHYSQKLTPKLFQLLKSWDEVEESLQELFTKVWENREIINPDKSFQSYLFKIAINIANDYYRKISKDKALSKSLFEQIAIIYHSETLPAQIRADEELMRVIERLPPQRKIVFKLCKLEGHSYAEVSKLLSISEATIGDHIAKANRFILSNFDKSVLFAIILYSSS